MNPPSTPPWLLSVYPPSRLGLLDHLRGLVDSAMLHEISIADYGEDAEAHLAVLERIWREGDLPEPLLFQPLEVLQLTRWEEPTQDEGRRAHVQRGFVCAVLLLAGAHTEYYGDDEDPTLIQLIESALQLGEPVPELTARHITWQLEKYPYDDHVRPFYAFGLLILTLLDPRSGITEPQAASLCDWVIAEEKHTRDLLAAIGSTRTDRWLLGIHRQHEAMCDKWISYFHRARDAAPFPQVAALAERLS